MLAKRVTRIGRSFFQILGKAQLSMKRIARLDGVRLSPFAFPNFSRGRDDFIRGRSLEENAPVVISKNEVAVPHLEIAKARCAER